jgi:uncharacterized protein YaaW (UPF0174 family)
MTHVDYDLDFMRRCSNDDLRKLCDILTFNNSGTYRIGERLTKTDAYIENYPENMREVIPEMCLQLQEYGTNSIVTLVHGGRPDAYEDIVRRVCKKMKVDVGDASDTIDMERLLLQQVCETAIGKMSDEELRELAEEAGIKAKKPTKQLIAAAILAAIKKKPQIFCRVAIYITSRIMALLGGRAAAAVGARVVQEAFGVVTGPVGWIVLTAWTIWDLASPAYRVIIPAVLQVAVMRFTSTPLLTGRRAS